MNLSIIHQIEEDIASDDLYRAFDQLEQLFKKLDEFVLEDQTCLQRGRLSSHISKFNAGEIDYDSPTINKIRLSGLELKRELIKMLERKGIHTEQQLQNLLTSKASNLSSGGKDNNTSSGFTISIGSVNGGIVNNAQKIEQQISIDKNKPVG